MSAWSACTATISNAGRGQYPAEAVPVSGILAATRRDRFRRPHRYGREAFNPGLPDAAMRTRCIYWPTHGLLRSGGGVPGPDKLYAVPRGLDHCRVAEEEVHPLLIEPAGTPNSGGPAKAVVKIGL